MRIAPPFDESRRPRIGFRILGEFHERTRHRLVQVRQLESEDVRLMLDMTRKAGVHGREKKRENAADGEQPGNRGGIGTIVDAPANAPTRETPFEEPLRDEEAEEG